MLRKVSILIVATLFLSGCITVNYCGPGPEEGEIVSNSSCPVHQKPSAEKKKKKK